MFTGLSLCRFPVTRQGDDSHPLSSGVIYCRGVGASNLIDVGPRAPTRQPREDLTGDRSGLLLYTYDYLSSKRLEEGR